MKALAFVPVLALAAFTFAAPPLAEAAQRHGRDDGRRGYGYSHNWDRRPVVGYRHYDRGWDHGRRGYTSRYYGAYGYRYDDLVPYYDSGYYAYVPPPPPPRIFYHRRHRPHVGLFLGF
jgi:hypothetical protein